MALFFKDEGHETFAYYVQLKPVAPRVICALCACICVRKTYRTHTHTRSRNTIVIGIQSLRSPSCRGGGSLPG